MQGTIVRIDLASSPSGGVVSCRNVWVEDPVAGEAGGARPRGGWPFFARWALRVTNLVLWRSQFAFARLAGGTPGSPA